MCLGEGFGVGFRRVVGGSFPVESEGKGDGDGEGGGWDRDRQRNRQVIAQALSKLPFSNLPFSFSSNSLQKKTTCFGRKSSRAPPFTEKSGSANPFKIMNISLGNFFCTAFLS